MAAKGRGASGRIVDFYQMFSLDQNASAKEIKKSLRTIQADIRTAMSDGSLNDEEIMKRLQEQSDQVTQAMKCFKNDETKAKYDKELEAAYKSNKVDVEAQKLSQELFEEIAMYFAKQQYKAVISKCVDAINNNVRDIRLYEYLAKSYRLLGDAENALDAVEKGLKVDGDNLDLLKIGSRVYTVNYQNYDEAQKIINHMAEIDKGCATAEQIHLYLNFGKDEIAYQTLDEYMAAHPADEVFKQNCAYDIIGMSYNCYDDCLAEDGTEVSLLLSEEAYQKCLAYCKKAVSLYSDENTRNALEYAEHFGKTEFNEDNASDVKWCLAGAALFLLAGFMSMGAVASLGEGGVGTLFAGVLQGLLFISIPIVITGGLIKESYRPYWKIYKYIFTGERDMREKVFIVLGRIFSCYIRLGWWMTKFVFRIMFSFF